jgi:hypothetical protein
MSLFPLVSDRKPNQTNRQNLGSTNRIAVKCNKNKDRSASRIASRRHNLPERAIERLEVYKHIGWGGSQKQSESLNSFERPSDTSFVV